MLIEDLLMVVNSSEKEDAVTNEPRASVFMDEKLFKSRCLTIFGEINDKIARSITERLLALASENDEPITLYISSPGGHVGSGEVVYNIKKFIKPVVRVIGTGWVASAAATIYLAADKENRFALPNTRFLIHQPLGGSRGDATDIAIQAEQMVKTRSRINQLIAEETGQPVDKVAQDTDRDYWMTVDEALSYGIVSKVVNSIEQLSE